MSVLNSLNFSSYRQKSNSSASSLLSGLLLVVCSLHFVIYAKPANALTLKVANQGDALSMDPHSLNESLQLMVNSQVYEALVMRDREFKLAPGLATSWKQTAPTIWHFELRKNNVYLNPLSNGLELDLWTLSSFDQNQLTNNIVLFSSLLK